MEANISDLSSCLSQMSGRIRDVRHELQRELDLNKLQQASDLRVSTQNLVCKFDALIQSLGLEWVESTISAAHFKERDLPLSSLCPFERRCPICQKEI